MRLHGRCDRHLFHGLSDDLSRKHRTFYNLRGSRLHSRMAFILRRHDRLGRQSARSMAWLQWHRPMPELCTERRDRSLRGLAKLDRFLSGGCEHPGLWCRNLRAGCHPDLPALARNRTLPHRVHRDGGEWKLVHRCNPVGSCLFVQRLRRGVRRKLQQYHLVRVLRRLSERTIHACRRVPRRRHKPRRSLQRSQQHARRLVGLRAFHVPHRSTDPRRLRFASGCELGFLQPYWPADSLLSLRD